MANIMRDLRMIVVQECHDETQFLWKENVDA